MATFADFRRGPGGVMCRSSLGVDIDRCVGWDDLAIVVRKAMNHDGLFDRVKLVDRTLSPGERVVLHAILHTSDYDRLADELSGDSTWQRMSRVSGEHLEAVVACIMRRNT